MHVFRNTMDHGLEVTADRVANGKPAQGKICVEVDTDEDHVVFTVADDGRGLALERIYQKALSNGQLTAEQTVTDEQISEMIFLSGLSTAAAVTNVSGRGVGMDAVRQFLNKHLGDVRLEFTGPSVVKGYRPFKLVITLPAKFAYRMAD